MTKVRKAVIPAAGFGTRFLPQTKAMPKEMLPLVDKPVIQYVVEELVDAGITDIILVTGYHKRTIEDHFDAANLDLIRNLEMGGEKKKPLLEEVKNISSLANFAYVRQKGPYGNGTPLMNVRHLIGDEPFIYSFSDDFIVSRPKSRFRQMIDLYGEFNCSVLSSIRAKRDEDYDRYGFSGGKEIREGIVHVDKIVEKPGKHASPSDLANVSSTLLTPEIFEYLAKAQELLGEGNELYYNDALKLMLDDGKKIIAADIKDGKYYDTGNKLEYMKAVVEMALDHKDVNGEFKEFLKNLKL